MATVRGSALGEAQLALLSIRLVLTFRLGL